MNVITLDTVNSTNIYAKNNMDVLEDKTVVRALHQTSGKGRLSRTWIDLGDGNIFISIVLKPSNRFSGIYANLTQYMSVVLCKTIEEYGLTSQIKWPNDVLIDGKKIAGILSETVVQGTTFKGLVLGAGINLNAAQKDIDSIPDKVATSLNLELGREINSDEFLNILISKFFSDYDNFMSKGFEFIKSDYISRTTFLDTEICVRGFKDTFSGIAKDISNSGELVLENNGKEFVLTIGDIL